MALLYGLLWRLLLLLVHVNTALVSWLRVRLRSWKGRLWERAVAALLLPVALAGFPDQQKKLNHNADANANPVTGNRGDSRRARWLSDGKALEKLPVHVGLLVAEEEPSYSDIANLVVWCMAVGISYVSVYDNHGIVRKNNSRLLEEILRQQQNLVGVDGSKYSVEFLSNGTDKHNESKNIPDPELVLKFGPVNSTLGFLPWHIRLTEFILYRDLLVTLALGQVLSLLICAIGLTSKFLADDFHANTPVFQSFLNYILLFLVYTTTLAVRQGEGNLLAILKQRWWKYMILGLVDIEANYLVLKAYQYTTLSSVQLLDCFVIPVVLLLSWFFLLVRYKAVHFVGAGLCLLGIGCMVGADVLLGRQQGLGEQKLFGDLLVLGGATLYGISNVCEEFIVKNLSRVEFLGMMGLFGSFFSGIQLAIMEHKELLKVPWDWQIGLLYIGFSAFMFGLYSFMPVVMKRTSAASVNLSLLTADLYSLFCGLFLFHYKFSGLYLLSFFVIILGLVLYSSSSTYVAQDPRVYKQFRNSSSQPASEPNLLSPGVPEPSVTYTSLSPEPGDELPVRVA
ncbi:solute carrier family 35 member F1 [Stegastes partitus]|uniref:Solute carrier family 35 member F1 n=1 Tax=Stegastes partitus TaxID=144197 RepID=A0A9Y4KJ65_9TELE|nr:PREDICTED: solute carrier family 35 member F1 [Stegastes partitus]